MTNPIWTIGLPLILVGGAAILVPFLLIPKDTRSHVRVSAGIGLSAALLLLLAAVVYLIFDDRDFATGVELRGVLGMAALALLGSWKSAILWVPLLAAHWLYAAQRVEKMRGEDMVRGDVG